MFRFRSCSSASLSAGYWMLEKYIANKPTRVLLNDNKAKKMFQGQIEKQLGSHVVSDTHSGTAWDDIQNAVETAAVSASKVNHKVRQKPWISVASTELMDTRKLIPPGVASNHSFIVI
ncbi:unnamed protein product [Schistosoma turkestanicum]|nr:unnamed protein product [Schistosoma turkestanicum]